MDESQSNSTAPKKSSPIVPIIIVVLLLAVGLGFMLKAGKSNTKSSTLGAETAQKQQVAPTAKTDMKPTETSSATAQTTDGVQTVTVEGGNFYFKPNEIHVKKGQKVTINFTNAGGFHDFNIDELNVHTDKIGSGKTATVSFTPQQTGTFEFYCSVGQHRQMGMKGNITVE